MKLKNGMHNTIVPNYEVGKDYIKNVIEFQNNFILKTNNFSKAENEDLLKTFDVHDKN